MKFPEESFSFLTQLIKNNNRNWFNERKQDFKELKKDNVYFFQQIMKDMQTFDLIENSKVFRIYRDVRFSKDKTPYKSHFAARYVREGKFKRGTYYLHIQPGNQSFCAGGFYGPNKEDLFRIRKEFELDAISIREILASPNLKKHFPKGLQGDELKTSPRGFDIDHPAIDLIRKKQFFLSSPFTDEELFNSNFSEKVVQKFEAMLPFLAFMSETVTTDLNGQVIV